MKRELAIIIPAYKTRFLQATLRSVANQGMEAALYIMDDASPHPVESLVHGALAGCGLDWVYHRFEQNLGGQALSRHFDRCVARTQEPWVWLFSDDDQMEPGCVAAFCRTLAETQGAQDVYCFDSVEVDAQDQLVALHPCLPDWEGWKQFAYFFLQYGRRVPQQAMVFSRAAYQRLGGYVDFPLGWAADQATLLALAGPRGLKRIAGPKVRFRNSGENISSTDDARLSSQKLQAAMQFMTWLLARIEAVPDPAFALSDEVLRRLAFDWFKRHLVQLHAWYSPAECVQVARFVQQTWGEPYARALGRMLQLWFRLGLDGVRQAERKLLAR